MIKPVKAHVTKTQISEMTETNVRQRVEAGARMGVFVVLKAFKYAVYHCGKNNYSFDALQAYCFGINLKL